MWLLVAFIAAVAVSVAHFGVKGLKRFRLDFLALMLWGAFVMIAVDRAIGFMLEGGELVEFATDGLVESALLLGILMLVPLGVAWSLFAFAPRRAKLPS